jgi:alkanesulfonate monooxygenase SsuD/methylene tetrahydromethanopterin reductase-like flavin-dependent oxidoreductase (luciferase family)
MTENLGQPNDGRLNFGVFLDSSIPTNTSRARGEVLNETLQLVELIEELGFDGAWFPEHHFHYRRL